LGKKLFQLQGAVNGWGSRDKGRNSSHKQKGCWGRGTVAGERLESCSKRRFSGLGRSVLGGRGESLMSKGEKVSGGETSKKRSWKYFQWGVASEEAEFIQLEVSTGSVGADAGKRERGNIRKKANSRTLESATRY